MRNLLVTAMLTTVVLAGCIGDDATDDKAGVAPEKTWPAPKWAIDAVLGGQGHDHKDHSHHAGRSTPNFIETGFDPHITEYAGATSGGYLCGEAATFDNRSIAVTQSHFDAVALVVADVTDPAAPFLLGELVLEGIDVYDSALTDDAQFAVVAVTGPNTDYSPTAQIPVRAKWNADCGEVAGPFVMVSPTPSVLLVDLSDPTKPTVVDQFQQPGTFGVHSVSATTAGGKHYVVASTLNLVGPATYFTFLTIEDDVLGGPSFQYYGIYDASNAQSQSMAHGLLVGHNDGIVHEHPITGQILGYLSSWDGGFVIVEVVAQGVIRHVSDWGAILQQHGARNIHSAFPMDELRGERHLTIVGEEIISPSGGLPTGLVFVMDTTDPANPEMVAKWTIPVDEGGWDESIIFSPHYSTVVGDTVFTAMYHAGVWAFNMSEEHWPHPPTTGVWIPSTPSISPPPAEQSGWDVMTFAPSVLEVFALPDGTLVSWDSTAGIHTYRYQEDARVEPVKSWFE